MILKSAICENGHKISTTLKPEEKPLAKFCSQCGGKILDECEYCRAFIPGGTLKTRKFINFVAEELSYENEYRYESTYPIPNYCIFCGKPYPWTEKFLENYQQLLDLSSDEIDENLKNIIFSATQNLLKDNFSKDSIHFLILKKAFHGLSDITKLVLIDCIVQFAGESIRAFFS